MPPVCASAGQPHNGGQGESQCPKQAAGAGHWRMVLALAPPPHQPTAPWAPAESRHGNGPAVPNATTRGATGGRASADHACNQTPPQRGSHILASRQCAASSLPSSVSSLCPRAPASAGGRGGAAPGPRALLARAAHTCRLAAYDAQSLKAHSPAAASLACRRLPRRRGRGTSQIHMVQMTVADQHSIIAWSMLRRTMPRHY
jgi:hypothetical protein